MTLKELKENIEKMGMKKHANPTKEYKELCYIVHEYGEPYLNEITQYVWNFDDIQRYLADMAKEDGPTAMESALYLWRDGWTSEDYYYIDGNTVYPLTMGAVNKLEKRLLEEIEEGEEKMTLEELKKEVESIDKEYNADGEYCDVDEEYKHLIDMVEDYDEEHHTYFMDTIYDDDVWDYDAVVDHIEHLLKNKEFGLCWVQNALQTLDYIYTDIYYVLGAYGQLYNLDREHLTQIKEELLKAIEEGGEK